MFQASIAVLLSSLFLIKQIHILGIMYFQVLKERHLLPIAEAREEILHAIERSPVVLIRGETGSGKTTQVRITKCAILKLSLYFRLWLLLEIVSYININIVQPDFV